MEDIDLGESSLPPVENASKSILVANQCGLTSTEVKPGNSSFDRTSKKLRWPGYLERLSILKLQRDDSVLHKSDSFLPTSSPIQIKENTEGFEIRPSHSFLDLEPEEIFEGGYYWDINSLLFREPISIESNFELSSPKSINPTVEQIAFLLNSVLFPMRDIIPSQIIITRVGSALTNLVYHITLIDPPFQNPNRPLPPLLENVSGSGNIYPTHLVPSNLLLRIYGEGVNELISRSKELFWLNILGILGVGARILALFPNGRLEEFLSCKTLNKDEIKDPYTSKRISKSLCGLHRLSYYIPPIKSESRISSPEKSIDESLKLLSIDKRVILDRKIFDSTIGKNLVAEEIEKYYKSINSAHSKIRVDSKNGKFKLSDEKKFMKNESELFLNIDSWSELVANKLEAITELTKRSTSSMHHLPLIKTFISELVPKIQKYKKSIMDKYSHQDLIYAHNDLQYGNILKLDGTNEIMFIDFEYAGYNFRGADIANHFTEWMADYSSEMPHILIDAHFPSKEQRYNFYYAYLETEVLLKNFIDESKLDTADSQCRNIIDHDYIKQQAELLDAEVMDFVPGVHLRWGLWGLIQACISDIEFDYLEYGFQRIDRFVKSC
ncbi:putative choline kinase 2 [Smittium mucronatum]|uniref:Putative choline kinase 2 n=1 Tax=Smittium mucronatum TaxID=133383 RepID=A0A1R0GVW7_9FUNG|nr:putative choline kinase 2 [Smittium mucronatum]